IYNGEVLVSYRKRRRSLFDIFDEWIREMEEEMREFIEESEKLFRMSPEELEELRKKGLGPYVYGYRIYIGPDGKVKIDEFGNVRREGVKPKITEEAEPLADVIDEGDKVRIIVEMPGVEKDKIKLKASGKELIIQASNGRKYLKKLTLPDEVDVKSAKASYKNGILEIEFKKVRGASGEYEIRVD
ncbi:MAG: archaeal heat shock protein Hsp20, partial [Zestosphaera sp.]